MTSWTCTLILALCGAPLTVQPGTWTHKTEADFAAGTFDATAVSSLGELQLARKTQVLVASEAAPAVVWALATRGDEVYLAGGADRCVYRLADGKCAKLAELPAAMVCCLLADGEGVLAGAGGDQAAVFRVSPAGQVKPLWADKSARYVWALAPAPDGGVYAATGAAAKVIVLDAQGRPATLYEAPETLAKNFLCLAADGGKLYAGTDSGGLVFEIDPAARAGRVILDAEEEEISAVVPDGAGGLFVATADASKAGPDGAPAAPRGDSSGKAVDAPAPPTAPRPADDADNADAPATRPAEPRGDKPPPASAPAPKGAATAPSKDTPPREPASAPAAALAARAIAPAGKLAEPASKPRAPAARRAAPRARPPAAAAEETGNAVYHILPGGLVQTIFRRPVLILAMIRQDGRLILGTGNGGEIHSVSTDGDEIVRLADTDAKQVTALAIRGRDVLFATANKGSLAGLSSARAPAGTFTSAALDAAQIARWGTVRVEAATPAGAKLLLSTRSGNVSDPDDKTWSAWSKDQPVTGAFAPVASPPARFLQYRLTLAAAGDAAPAVREVEIVYQVGNLPPAVTAVKVTPNAQGASREQNTGGPLAYRHVEITAADPNNDPLTFDIAFREAGGETWVTIAEKHKEPKFVWDTRTVGDGKYELRVTASDASANPPGSQRTGARVSEIVVADNTAPVVRELLAKPDGRTIRLTGQAADALSRIATLAYCVDSQDDWTPVAPADGICDSPKEAFAAEIADLKPGAHRIAVRVTDALGNVGYASVNVTVK